MPKCLHPPCDRFVDDALYCDEHKYIPHWTTNVTRVQEPQVSIHTGDWPAYAPMPQSAPPAPHRAPVLWLALVILILAILAVGLIVILKLIF
jgi:hypothetical protein